MDIYQQLRRLLTKINLSENESRMLTASFVTPGLTPQLLGRQCGFKRMMSYRTLESLVDKNYLEVKTDPITKDRRVHALPLSKLATRFEKHCDDLKKFATQIRDISAVLRSTGEDSTLLSVKRYYEDEAREAFMDMHYLDWEHAYAIGDFDSYCKDWSHFQFEEKWFRKRAANGRKAIMAGHHIGPFTNEVVRNNERDLRTSVFSENSIKDFFVMAFPEVSITFIGSTEKESNLWTMLKIESAEISNIYTQLTKSFHKHLT